MTTYATVQQFRKAYDQRSIGALGSDSGTPGSVTESNSIITTALDRASADIRSYALRGELYAATDLDTLYAAGDWTLIGLTCDLAIGNLHSRRGGAMPDDIKDRVKRANETLKALADGLQVFNIAANIEAGIATVAVIPASTRTGLNFASDSPIYPARRTQQY